MMSQANMNNYQTLMDGSVIGLCQTISEFLKNVLYNFTTKIIAP